MYGRILVAIDGSNSGAKALKEVAGLATVHRAALRMAHVVDKVPPYSFGDTNKRRNHSPEVIPRMAADSGDAIDPPAERKP